MDGMKSTIAAVTSVLVAITLLPALLASGDTAPRVACNTGGSIGVILATIRTLESGGNYQASGVGSSASGAYQFLDTTWSDYRGYPRAADAPPAVQDTKATEH